jgi:hypothetical protein
MDLQSHGRVELPKVRAATAEEVVKELWGTVNGHPLKSAAIDGTDGAPELIELLYIALEVEIHSLP